MDVPANLDELRDQLLDLTSTTPSASGRADLNRMANLRERVIWLLAAVDQLREAKTLSMTWDESDLLLGGIRMGGTVQRKSGAGWVYGIECTLPGVAIPDTLLPLGVARQKLEGTVQEWFEKASRPVGAGAGLRPVSRPV